jgi:hypothetical protein
VRKTRLPTWKSIGRYLGHQVLINSVAWTAGLLAVGLVRSFFEVRSFRNLWGLFAWGDRTLVSADDYQAMTNVTSYLAGLVILIFVRHFILRVSTELHDLRLERDDFD